MNNAKIASKLIKIINARDEQLKSLTSIDGRFSDPQFRSDYITVEIDKMSDEEFLKVVLGQ